MQATLFLLVIPLVVYPHDSIIGLYFVYVTFSVPESSTTGHNQKRSKVFIPKLSCPECCICNELSPGDYFHGGGS